MGVITQDKITLQSVKSINDKAENAQTIAGNTNQHFWFTETGTDTGAHITEVTQEEFTDPTSASYQSGGNLLARSNGIAVRDGMTELASFGVGGAVLGETSKSHIELTSDKMTAYSGSGAQYFAVGDLIGTTATHNYTGDGETRGFLIYYPESTPTVTIDGVATTAFTYTNNLLTFTTAPADGSVIVITYTYARTTPYFTYGNRLSGSNVGGKSYAEGNNVTSSGTNSHAEGQGTVASGNMSHAEGAQTVASSYEAHAEGYLSEASGSYSHAQNWGTIASSRAQTAIGRWNIEDTAKEYAFIIGNGSSDASRANAMAVSWGGDVTAHGFNASSNSSVGGDLTVSGELKDGSGNVFFPFEVVTETITITALSASSDTSGSQSVTNLHLCVVGWNLAGTRATFVNINRLRISGGAIDYQVRNLGTNATGTLTLTVYCLKRLV